MGFLYKPNLAYSISAVSQAITTVEIDIAINRISDLDFGTALPGAPRLRIPPTNTENPQNASFLVTGIAGHAITITTPPGSIFITEPISGDQLEVRNFRSRPRGTSTIRNTGERMIFVGAARRAIPANASPGLYSGSFTVTVVY